MESRYLLPAMFRLAVLLLFAAVFIAASTPAFSSTSAVPVSAPSWNASEQGQIVMSMTSDSHGDVWVGTENQTLTAGSYTDPVGFVVLGDIVSTSDTQDIIGWTNANTLPLAESTYTTNFSVEVGASVISGFSTRVVSCEPPNQIQVIWP